MSTKFLGFPRKGNEPPPSKYYCFFRMLNHTMFLILRHKKRNEKTNGEKLDDNESKTTQKGDCETDLGAQPVTI